MIELSISRLIEFHYFVSYLFIIVNDLDRVEIFWIE